MKTLSIIVSLVIGLALAWTSFAPQPADAEDLIGGCWKTCSGTIMIRCDILNASCDRSWVRQCIGVDLGNCCDVVYYECGGPAPCDEYVDSVCEL